MRPAQAIARIAEDSSMRTASMAIERRAHEQWLLAADHARDASVLRFDPGQYPYDRRLRRGEYESKLRSVQIELVKLQRWIKSERRRLVILFEGRDAAGKGGTIKRFAEHLDPRDLRVIALEKPSEVERRQWYFQRYLDRLPLAGQIALFDRSWYNRAGVERVMGFCTESEYQAFFPQTRDLENALTQHGVLLFKLWFDVSRQEQRRRLAARTVNPLKQWKLSSLDLEGLERWDTYNAAEAEIFARTSSAVAPWVRFKSDCKRRARLQAISYLLHQLNYDGKIDAALEPIDPAIVTVAR
jgi:polyphosphate kinase 2